MSKNHFYEIAKKLYSFLEGYIYIIIGLLAIIMLFTVLIIPDGAIRSFILNLSSELFGASLVFLFVSWASKHNPDNELHREQNELILGLKDTIESLEETQFDVISYKTSGDLLSDFSARIRRAKRVDDVTWMEGEDAREKWTGQDLKAHGYLQETINDVSRKTDVIWREVAIFSSYMRYKQERQRILDPNTPGYNVAFYEPPPPESPPRIGFAVIDNEELVLCRDKVRLKIKHPEVVAYFSNYFNIVWERAIKLKRGLEVDKNLLDELDSKFPQIE